MEKKDNRGRKLYDNEDQLKDGRYRFRYTDKYGKRTPVYSWKLVPTDKIPKGKRDDISLREKEKKILRDLDDNIDTYSGNSTVDSLIQQYFSTKSMLAPATKNNYTSMWRRIHEFSSLPKLKISNVKKSDILKLYAYFYEERKYAVGTIQLYQNMLYPAFQIAVDDNIIRQNPCKGCMKGYLSNVTTSRFALTADQQDKLLEFLLYDSRKYSRYYEMFELLLKTGMRISETLGLTWDNIDFDNKIIIVDHQIIYGKKNGKYIFYDAPPKNRMNRIIPMQSSLVKVMKKYKEMTYFFSVSSGLKIGNYTNFVFLNKNGNVHKSQVIVRACHGICNEYNKFEEETAYYEGRDPVMMPDFTPHILRHSFCTRMGENGMDAKVLQSIMGHKNIAITMDVYNHVNDYERLAKEVDRVSKVMAI